MSALRSLFVLSLAGTLWGFPQGEQVVAGAASFDRTQEGRLSIVQQSDRAVINWKSFSIQKGEALHFMQPRASCAVLNRVVGPLKSEIFGTLKANGRVLLLNPNGVLIGKTGVIQTGGFLASTLEISDEEFMKGERWTFRGDSSQEVVSLGLIEASGGDVSLIGKAVNNEGVIRAARVEKQGGRVFLLAEGGRVELTDASVIDVSGELSGGEVYIGGGFQGKDPDIPNALLTYVGREARICSNGAEKGGSVVIWSDEATAFYGSLSATGYDGGFAEISSKGKLDCRGKIDLAALGGKAGELLLDPTNINVMAGGGAPYASVSTFAAGGALDVVDPATLVAVAGPVTLQATGNIQFLSPTALTTAGASLTAQAGDTITVAAGAPLTTRGGNITLQAGPFSGAPSPVASGSIVLNDAVNPFVSGATGGDITLQGFNITGNWAASQGVRTASGDIAITAGQDIALINTFDEIALQTNTGGVAIQADRHVNIQSRIDCLGAFTGTQVDIRADMNHDNIGDVTIQPGTNITSSVIRVVGNIFIGGQNINILGGTAPAGVAGIDRISTALATIELQAFQDIVIRGGTSTAAINANIDIKTNSIPSGNQILLRAGRDVLFQGGTGDGDSSVDLICPGALQVFAGRDISLIGGNGSTASDPGRVNVSGDGSSSVQVTSLFSGRNVTLTAGPKLSDSVYVGTARGVLNLGATNIYAGGNILATNGASGGSAFISRSVFAASTRGVNLRAGGDIQVSTSITASDPNQIFIQADGTFSLWPAQVGPYLTGTPLASASSVAANGLGAYRTDTGAAANGISLTTVSGTIALYSSNLSAASVPTNLNIGPAATSNLTTITSTSGSIAVAGFQNIDIANPVTTSASILIAAANDMTIQAAGRVTSGASVTLIVDQQNPSGVGGGRFINLNNTNGVTTTNAAQNIAIYAASGPEPPGTSPPVTNLVTLGNLSSLTTWDAVVTPLELASKYNTSYSSGGPYHGPGFGTAYVAGQGVFGSSVIWYKAFSPLPVTIAVPAVFALTNEERLPIDIDPTMRLFREEFGIYHQKHPGTTWRAFGKQDWLDNHVPEKNDDYFMQSIIDNQRWRLMDAKLSYPFVKEKKEEN